MKLYSNLLVASFGIVRFVTAYNKHLSNQYNAPAQIEQVQDKRGIQAILLV
jgi:hypothetical protein